MNCPHCDKMILVRLTKDDGKPTEGADASGLGEILAQIHADELEHQGEIDFVKQTRERFAQYAERTRMSEKQMTWLRKIAAK